MSDERPFDPPPTPEEETAARRFAEALESAAAGPDRDLAAARLLQALGASGRRDDLASRRLRRELVRATGRRQRMQRVRMLAAASVLLAAGATTFLLGRHGAPQGDASIALRESQARAAVERLLAEGAPETARLSTLTETLRVARLDSLWEQRRESVLSSSSSEGTTRPTPTPGGPVS
jgi:hypothetical protein